MGIFKKLTKIAMETIELPVSVVKDAVTMGSQLTDEGDPYTLRNLKSMGKTFKKIKDDLDE